MSYHVMQYDDNAGERSILLFHVHVFVETRLRWNDDDDDVNGGGDDGGVGGGDGGKGKDNSRGQRNDKGKQKGKGKGQNGGLRSGSTSSKHKDRDEEWLLPLYAPRHGREYFPPHMIVYQHV